MYMTISKHITLLYYRISIAVAYATISLYNFNIPNQEELKQSEKNGITFNAI